MTNRRSLSLVVLCVVFCTLSRSLARSLARTNTHTLSLVSARSLSFQGSFRSHATPLSRFPTVVDVVVVVVDLFGVAGVFDHRRTDVMLTPTLLQPLGHLALFSVRYRQFPQRETRNKACRPSLPRVQNRDRKGKKN